MKIVVVGGTGLIGFEVHRHSAQRLRVPATVSSAGSPGAFQMSGRELSTAARLGLNPIVFVLNNKGYTTERFICEGPYNDIHDWAYLRVPDVLRAGWRCEVRTEGELEDALAKARANTDAFSIVNVHLDKLDRSTALERLGKRLGERVAGLRS